MFSLIVFIIATLVYFIIKYYVSSSTTLRIAAIVYFIGVIMQQVFSNNNAIKDLCGTHNISSAFIITIIPWIFIFGVLYTCLTMFPSWKVPFSNTFGYLVIKIAGLNSLLKQIYNFDKVPNKTKIATNQKDSEMLETLNNLYKNPAPIINQIPEPMLNANGEDPGFNKFWEDTKRLLKPSLKGDELIGLKEQLEKMVKLKYIVSEFVWYLLTGIYITMISANSVINNGCNRSVADMKKRHNQYDKDVAAEEKKPEPKKQVYYVND